MASREWYDKINKLVQQVHQLDISRIVRKNFDSRPLGFTDEIMQLPDQADKLLELIGVASFDEANAADSHLRSLVSTLQQVQQLSDQQYLSQASGHNSNLQQQFRAFRNTFAQIYSIGIASDLSHSPDYETKNLAALQLILDTAKKDFETLSAEARDSILIASKNAIEGVTTQSREIIQNARQTSLNTALGAAQSEFQKASMRNLENWKRSVGFASGAILCFFGALLLFYFEDVKALTYEEAILKLGLRVTILVALGGVIAFLLRIMRAQLHLREQNLHREHLANSMAAFVESANTLDQRDVILSKLVDAIAVFGNSGLIANSDDNILASKMTLDSVTRTIGGGK